MGDYTSASFVLWHAGPKKKLKIEELIGEHFGFTKLPMGVWVNSADEVRCGIVSEISDQLVELAPKAIWQMYEDPKYEWLGTCAWYHPIVGLYEANCDADGRPVVGIDSIESTEILRTTLSVKDLWDAQVKLASLFGRPQLKAIEASRAVIALRQAVS